MKRMHRAIFTLLFCLSMSQALPQTTIYFPLSAWTTGISTMWDGTVLQFYGFSRGLTFPTLPGPTITCNEGDSVIIDMRNRSQGAGHTIHLHGLDVDQANDGVPHTSHEIGHQATGRYRFYASHAGTYFYHCHVLSILHVQLGMYGSIIVRANAGAQEVWTGGPSFDREYNWLSSEIDQEWFDSIPSQHIGDSTVVEVQVKAYQPDFFLVNGKANQNLDTLRSARIVANSGEKVHLRLGNMGYLANKVIFPAALNAEVVASDGRPLPSSLAWDTLWVYPGERYSVLLDMAGAMSDSIAISWVDLFSGQTRYQDHIPYLHGIGIGFRESETDPLQMHVYPQPADEWAVIQLPTTRQPSSFSLVGMDGKMVRSGNCSAGQAMLSISTKELPAGIFVLKLQSGNRSGHIQVLVQH
jgi:hypothetical protein